MIFVVDGQPIKFFIQKDLPDALLKSVEEAIKEEGGSVETKVPRRGYVIIQPGTPEAERLNTTWKDDQRPHRHFLPYTWIQACRKRARLLGQVFVENARPIKIHIHKSIANMRTREDLVETITLHGGDPNASEEDATVILASSQVESFREMRKQLQGSEEKFVENLTWLETCIDQELYYHSPNPVKNAGGRRAGDERTAFSDEDEANLCNWIALVIPYKESGGRTGNKIYQELVSRIDTPGYEWVGRHTWQSWRERYKKNAARLDQHIAAIVGLNQANGIVVPNKAQFGHFRLTEGKSTPRRRHRKNKDEQGFDFVFQNPERFMTDGSGTHGLTHAQESRESEWAIREGSDPVPNWAKRTTLEDADAGGQKRLKTGSATYRTFVLTSSGQVPSESGPSYSTATEFAQDFGALDAIDQEILGIARELQFLPAEVHAYYDRTHDIVATRQRYERVRALMNTMP